MFGHLRSFKGWIQTEACVIPSYHGMLIRETNKDIISIAVLPSKKLFFQPKLKHNNVRKSVSEPPNVIRKAIPEFGSQI